MQAKIKDKIISLLVPGIFILIGAISFVEAISCNIEGRQLKENCTNTTTATVINIIAEEKRNVKNHYVTMYAPVFEYSCSNKTYNIKHSSFSTDCKYKLNEQIEIKYNPNKPTEYYILSEHSSNLFSLIFFIVGIVLSGTGIIILISDNSHNNRVEANSTRNMILKKII